MDDSSTFIPPLQVPSAYVEGSIIPPHLFLLASNFKGQLHPHLTATAHIPPAVNPLYSSLKSTVWQLADEHSKAVAAQTASYSTDPHAAAHVRAYAVRNCNPPTAPAKAWAPPANDASRELPPYGRPCRLVQEESLEDLCPLRVPPGAIGMLSVTAGRDGGLVGTGRGPFGLPITTARQLNVSDVHRRVRPQDALPPPVAHSARGLQPRTAGATMSMDEEGHLLSKQDGVDVEYDPAGVANQRRELGGDLRTHASGVEAAVRYGALYGDDNGRVVRFGAGSGLLSVYLDAFKGADVDSFLLAYGSRLPPSATDGGIGDVHELKRGSAMVADLKGKISDDGQRGRALQRRQAGPGRALSSNVPLVLVLGAAQDRLNEWNAVRFLEEGEYLLPSKAYKRAVQSGRPKASVLQVKPRVLWGPTPFDLCKVELSRKAVTEDVYRSIVAIVVAAGAPSEFAGYGLLEDYGPGRIVDEIPLIAIHLKAGLVPPGATARRVDILTVEDSVGENANAQHTNMKAGRLFWERVCRSVSFGCVM